MRPWQGVIGTGFTPDDFDRYVQSLQFGAWTPAFVVLHNTAIPRFSEWHSVPGPERMNAFTSYYRDTMHWSAGPHLFVADDLIWVFTPLTTYGIHSPSWNTISWGVEMVGDYTAEPFNTAVRDNAVRALTTLHATMGIDPTTLRLHREDKLTTHQCPGDNVHKDEMISLVQVALQGRAVGDHLASRLA